ncbi:MAG: MG2 domain-containing protein [Massilia sp.]
MRATLLAALLGACQIAPAAPAQFGQQGTVHGADTGGPSAELLALHDPDNWRAVLEHPVVVFKPSTPLDPATLRYLGCSVNRKMLPVRILSGAARKAAITRVMDGTEPGEQARDWIAARCGAARWPQQAEVGWVWDKRIANLSGLRGEATVSYWLTVRGALELSISCAELSSRAGCDPRGPIDVTFPTALERQAGEDLVLQGSSGKRYPLKAQGCDGKAVCAAFQAAGVFDEGDSLTLTLPPGLRDADGNVLPRPKQPLQPIDILRLPAYVGMLASNVVVPWQPGRVLSMPLALRNTEPEVPVRSWRLAGGAAAVPSLIALHRLVESGRAMPPMYEPTPYAPFAVGEHLLALMGQKSAAAHDLVVRPAGKAMDVVGVPLSGYGSWLLQADSGQYEAAIPPDRRDRHDLRWGEGAMASLSLVQLTNLDLHVRLSPGARSLVWVTALDSARPVAGAEVELWSCDGKRILAGRADAAGAFLFDRLPADLECTAGGRDLWIVARMGDDMVLLHLRDVDTALAPSGLLSHTILDRVLLRAGDTLSMQTVLRAQAPAGWSIPAGLKGNLTIVDPMGKQVHIQPFEADKAGSALASWTIPASAALGRYQGTVSTEDGVVLGVSHFQVEEFRVPAFDAGLDAATTRHGDGQTLTLSARLRFLAGGAAAGREVSVKGHFEPLAPDRVGRFWFADDPATTAQTLAFPEVPLLVLDRNGERRVSVQVPRIERPVSLYAEMSFADPNGEIQARATLLDLWPQRYRVGLVDDSGSVTGRVNATALVLDQSGNPVAGHQVSFEAEPMPAAGATRILLCTAVTGADGKAACRAGYEPAGARPRWRLHASAAEASSTVLDMGGRRYGPLAPGNDIGLPASPLAGQPLALVLRPPFVPATALLSVERDGVIGRQVFALDKSEQTVTLPTDRQFAPKVNLAVAFVRAEAPESDRQPGARLQPRSATAVAELAFEPRTHRLLVEVSPAEASARPGQSVKARIKVAPAAGEPPLAGARVTVIAFDDALTALKPNNSFDLLPAFWRAQLSGMRGMNLSPTSLDALWPRAQTSYWPPNETLKPHTRPVRRDGAPSVQVWGATPSTQSAIVRKKDSTPGEQGEANDGAYRPDPMASRANFSTLALWKTDLALDAAGEAVAQIPLPDALTRWRIVAVAQEGADRYGEGSAFVQTRRNVQVIAGLPPSVRVGDRLEQQLTLRNDGASGVTLQLKARATALADPMRPDQALPDTGALTLARSVSLAPHEDKVVAWTVAIPDGLAALDWRIEARDRHGEGDALDVRQQVLPVVPFRVIESRTVLLDHPVTLALSLPPGALANNAGVKVSWQSGRVGGALKGAREWMLAYPYRCMEQMSSRAVVAGDAAAWSRAMALLPGYLDQDGLAEYFPHSGGNEVLTTYLLDIAAAYGLALPAPEKSRMQAALRRALTSGSNTVRLNDNLLLAHRLAMQAAIAPLPAALAPVVPAALDKLPAIALLDWVRYLLTTPDDDERRTRLAAASVELRSRYRIENGRLVSRTRVDEESWAMMWTADVLNARLVHLAEQWRSVDPSWNDELPALRQGLINSQSGGHWNTTIANAWGVVALDSFARAAEAALGGVSRAVLGGTSAEGRWPAPQPVRMAWPKGGDSVVLALSHEGGGAPWATVQSGAAIKLQAPAAHGLTVLKSLSAVEQKVPGQWSPGDIVRVTLMLSGAPNLGWLALNDPIPSGATILGKDLGGQSAVTVANPDAYRTTWPVHRELGADSYRAFFDRAPDGPWRTSYLLRFNNAGLFQLPPTRIEAMYVPDAYGETPNPALEVKP